MVMKTNVSKLSHERDANTSIHTDRALSGSGNEVLREHRAAQGPARPGPLSAPGDSSPLTNCDFTLLSIASFVPTAIQTSADLTHCRTAVNGVFCYRFETVPLKANYQVCNFGRLHQHRLQAGSSTGGWEPRRAGTEVPMTLLHVSK